MAINWQVRKDGKLLTLNEFDELMCEVQEIEVNKDKYCALYQIMTTSFIGMAVHNKTLFEVLDEDYGQEQWYIDFKEQLEEFFKDIEITVWRD